MNQAPRDTRGGLSHILTLQPPRASASLRAFDGACTNAHSRPSKPPTPPPNVSVQSSRPGHGFLWTSAGLPERIAASPSGPRIVLIVREGDEGAARIYGDRK